MSVETTTLPLTKFSPAARRLVTSAQAKADAAQHAEVTPLHLLAASLEQPAIAKLFERVGADPVQLGRVVERLLTVERPTRDVATLSRSLILLLERAEGDTQHQTDDTVTVGDLLNALCQEIRGPVAEVLTTFGLGPGSLRPHTTALDAKLAAEPPRAAASDDWLLDWVAAARSTEPVPVIGRDAEVLRTLAVLERHSKNCPVLVGEPGVGKRAIVRAVAALVAGGKVPPGLRDAAILELDVGRFVAGTRLRSDVEGRTSALMARLEAAPRSILFVSEPSELFTQVGVGSVISDLCRGALLAGKLRMIATSTRAGWKKLCEKEPTLSRALTSIPVEEPSLELATAIARGAASRYEAHHDVRITDGAIAAAVSLAKRYVQERSLPDSALDLLDEAAAKRRIAAQANAAAGENTATGSSGTTGASTTTEPLDESHVAATLAEWTGIPVHKMLEAEAQKLLQMEARLGERVVGQAAAIGAIARAVRRARAGLKDPKRPIGSFLFLGPSGVGKTELAKALAEFLFDDEHALTRLDMSEFMERHMAQRLLGAPPGYADSEEGGFLTEAVRRRPYSVLLFDEVEKAHADVFNLLLQLLDDGRLTDGRGRVADFSNTVVILTSNIGAKHIAAAKPGTLESEAGQDAVFEAVRSDLGEFFRPEFLNRIGETVMFRPLGKPELGAIVELQIQKLGEMLAARKLRIELDPSAKDQLVELGYDPALGARPVQRVIARQVQDPLAEAVLSDRCPEGSTLRVSFDGGEFRIESRND